MQQLHTTWDALNLLRSITTRILLEKDVDLSARQMGILLTVYLTPPPHTVKNLSERLKISKPAVCRAIDTLSKLGFIRRKKDEKDNRIVYIQRTIPGSVFLSEIAEIVMTEANGNTEAVNLKISA
jgi:DNA-binding MarR family transcriptional regulator